MHEALQPLVEARWLDETTTSAVEVAGLWTLVDRDPDEPALAEVVLER